jgi:hypothetical protein
LTSPEQTVNDLNQYQQEPQMFPGRTILNKFARLASTGLGGLCLVLLLVQTAQADQLGRPYFPIGLTELSYRHALTFQMDSGKINLNQATVQELTTLPDINENLALKLVRLRPMTNLQDLNQLKASCPEKFVQRLIQNLKDDVRF